MLLDAQQLFALSQGAELFEERDGAVFFSRFNEEELALYRTRPEFFTRAEATAGIQLEFTTDAEAIRLCVTPPAGEAYSSIYAYDILVNGALIGQLSNMLPDPENGHYWDFIDPDAVHEKLFFLGTGEKQVRIVFPWSKNLGIRHLELSGATFARPVDKKRNLLIYGDSITQGSTSLYPSRTYAALLGTWLDARTCNKGVGSEMYWPELAGVQLGWEPDIITVAYGINDWCTVSRDVYAENCRKFWLTLCANHPGVKKFAMTPIWYPNHDNIKTFGPFEDLAQVIREATADLPDVTVIDCTDFVSRDTKDYGDLWIHPNHIGFEKFFQNLSQAIGKNFNRFAINTHVVHHHARYNDTPTP